MPWTRNLEDHAEASGAGGLIAGASGLLALVYPKDFGTVDQFVVKALRKVPGALDGVEVGNPESIGKKAGAGLIRIVRDKAAELNRVFLSEDWTPRKVAMVMWAVGRGWGKMLVFTDIVRGSLRMLVYEPRPLTGGAKLDNRDEIENALLTFCGR